MLDRPPNRGGLEPERFDDPADAPFGSPREAALALLTGETRLTRKAGQFLGQIAVDRAPLTDRQAEWLAALLERAGLPAFEAGAGGGEAR
jgi:hypothetical protein